MRKIARFAVLGAALLSVMAGWASSAGAVTWHNTGDATFDATAGAVTMSATGANGLVCPSGGTLTGTVATAPFVGLVWTAITGTVKWANCQLGVTGGTIDCAYAFTATSWQAGPPAVTSGTADVTCGLWFANVKLCHMEGNVEGHYTNPSASSTTGSLTVTTGGNVRVTNGSGSSCPLGPNDKGHLSEATFRVTSGGATMGPIITRTS